MKKYAESKYYPFPENDREELDSVNDKICFSVAFEYLLEEKLPAIDMESFDMDSFVNEDVIKDNWDEILRVLASYKIGRLPFDKLKTVFYDQSALNVKLGIVELGKKLLQAREEVKANAN